MNALLLILGFLVEPTIDWFQRRRTAQRLRDEELQRELEEFDVEEYMERRTGVSDTVTGTYSTLFVPGLRKDMSWEDPA